MIAPKNTPIKIRAVYIPATDTTEVRLSITHPMDTGQIKDDAGNTIKKWHVTQVIAKYEQQTVLSMHLGTAVSKDPYLFFKFKGGAKNKTISVQWWDSQGDTRQDSAKIV